MEDNKKHQEEVLIELPFAKERKKEYTEVLLHIVSEELLTLCKEIAMNSGYGGIANTRLALRCLKRIAKRFGRATQMPIFSKTWNLLTSAMHGDVLDVYYAETHPLIKHKRKKGSKKQREGHIDNKLVYSDGNNKLDAPKLSNEKIINQIEKQNGVIRKCKTCRNEFSTKKNHVNCIECRKFLKKGKKGRDQL